MDVIKKISRYVLFFVAIAFIVMPSKSKPGDEITWQEIVFYAVFIGVILDNLLFAFGVPQKALQLYSEIAIYLSIIIYLLVVLLTGKPLLALRTPELKEAGAQLQMTISLLLIYFLIISSSILILVDAKNILLKLKKTKKDRVL
jgi:hypothetical protein